jgi:hypothetical protein
MMPAKNTPCDVCGRIKNNVTEPRYYYTVCEDHRDMSPIEVTMIVNTRRKL